VAPRRPPVAIEVGLPVLLVIVALVMAYWVYRVGDIGSRAVWNPEGSVNYSTSGGQ
jgi:hypothetical protein